MSYQSHWESGRAAFCHWAHVGRSIMSWFLQRARKRPTTEPGVTVNFVRGQFMPSTELLPRWKHTKPAGPHCPASDWVCVR